jgi:4-hydroxybenzoate polyprenyltransferase
MTPEITTKAPPLCVDLDGTLIRTDLLFESVVRLLKHRPWLLVLLPVWLMRGRAVLKRNLASQVSIDPRLLPYDERVLAWLRAEKSRGREIVLATSADESFARAVADHLGLFSRVFSSDGRINLKGARKLEALRGEIPDGFEYAGNSEADFEIWCGCEGAILVNASASLTRRVRSHARVVVSFEKQRGGIRSYLRALRVHQWSKNILIFVALIGPHELLHSQPELFLRSMLAAVLFCFCSSAQYILNDLIDLEADRRHPVKRKRPFAAGSLSILQGFFLCIGLLAGSVIAAWYASALLVGLLAVYFTASLTYSLWLKKIVVLDVFVLAGLYTYRIVAGHLVIGAAFSVWLVSFSLFLFLSLALCKRMAELKTMDASGIESSDRPYTNADLNEVNLLGVCSAFLAAVVFILYLQSDTVRRYYSRPQLLWLLAPAFLYWISRTWMLTNRGEMTGNDPVLFTLKDPVTYVIAVIAGLIMFAASSAWHLSLRW